MELVTFDKYLDKYSYPLVVTIGSFDGIHLGHQELTLNMLNLQVPYHHLGMETFLSLVDNKLCQRQ